MRIWITILTILAGSTAAFAQEGEKHKRPEPAASEPVYTTPKTYDDEAEYKTFRVSPSSQESKSCAVQVTVEIPTQEIIEFVPRGCETYDGINPELFFDNKGNPQWIIHFEGEGEKPDAHLQLEDYENKPNN